MPERKSKNSEDENPISCLRRSPRLRRGNLINAPGPITPENAETGSARPNSFSTPLTKIKKTSHRVSRNGGGKDSESNSEKSRNGCRRSARTTRGTNFGSSDLEKKYARENHSAGNRGLVKGAKKAIEGSRTSRRRDRGVNVSKSDAVLCLDKERVMEKRVTRSSICRNKVAIQDLEEDFSKRVVNLTKEQKAKIGVDDLKKSLGKVEKRVSRTSSKSYVKKDCNVGNTRKKAVILDETEQKEGAELSKIDKSKKDCGIVRRNEEESFTRKGKIGEKRKRDEVEGGCEIAQGWSKEQEIALQRAYFTAKPTPLFWKKVSRMVPGKSAEECFDRIHSNHLTPPQPRTRSRAKIKELSPLSFSASKLLQPTELNTKRLGFRRRTLLAQKTVRQILQNQQKEDQDYNADIFSLLEPNVNPSPLQESTSFLSPKPNKSCSFLKGFKQIPSSSRKNLSRLEGVITSPPVLKQIKNKVLHEKYIDQLHCRDAKRKAEALRKARNVKGEIHVKQNLVEVARNALVCDAQDAISKFRSLQSRIDEEGSMSDVDEDDDENENDGV